MGGSWEQNKKSEFRPKEQREKKTEQIESKEYHCNHRQKNISDITEWNQVSPT